MWCHQCIYPGTATPSNMGNKSAKRDLEQAASRLANGQHQSRDYHDPEISSLTSTQQSDRPDYPPGKKYTMSATNLDAILPTYYVVLVFLNI